MEFCCKYDYQEECLQKWLVKMHFLSFRTWAEASNCFSISMGPVMLTVNLLNYSIWIIFCLSATAPKTRVILYSNAWRLKSLLQLELVGILIHPPAQRKKTQVQRHFDIWVHVASLFSQRRVAKYSGSQSRSSRIERVGGEYFVIKLMLLAKIAA